MSYCMNLIIQLRKNKEAEHELKEFYEKLADQVEEYMCRLLDEVRVTTMKIFTAYTTFAQTA